MYSRPSKPQDEWIVARKDANGSIGIEAHPGDGTRYTMLLTHILDDDVAEIIGCSSDDWQCVLTSWVEPRVFMFDPKGLLHWSYIDKKIGMGVPSSVVLGIIIGMVTGVDHISWDEFILNQL